MKRGPIDFQAKKVVLSLAAALIWILTGTAIAPARSPGLPEVPAQAKPRAAKNQPGRVPAVLTGISPNAAPPGGTGELVLTGKNFVPRMGLRLACATTSEFKVESPQRAVIQIKVSLEEQEGDCRVALSYPPSPKDETGESPQGTVELAQVAPSVKFTINKNAPMPILLGEYTLFPEEEISVRNSMAATGQDMQKRAEASKPTKKQEDQIQKQADDLKTLQAKHDRGEISDAEFMAAAMKAASGMMGQLTPQQRGAMGQQATAAAQVGQTSKKLADLTKQEKRVEVRLNQGSISVLDGKNPLYTQKASALKEITVVPPLPDKESSQEFQMAFSDGKKYCFRLGSNDNADDEVTKLKKHLGR